MNTWLKLRWKRLCAVLSLGVATLGGLPYDLGTVSTMIPPKYKVHAFVAGGLLFVVFQVIQKQHSSVKLPEEKTIHIYHHFPDA